MRFLILFFFFFLIFFLLVIKGQKSRVVGGLSAFNGRHVSVGTRNCCIQPKWKGFTLNQFNAHFFYTNK